MAFSFWHFLSRSESPHAHQARYLLIILRHRRHEAFSEVGCLVSQRIHHAMFGVMCQENRCCIYNYIYCKYIYVHICDYKKTYTFIYTQQSEVTSLLGVTKVHDLLTLRIIALDVQGWETVRREVSWLPGAQVCRGT